jgi:hypothetical protein
MRRELPGSGSPAVTVEAQSEGIHTGGKWEEIHLMAAGRWDAQALLAFPKTASRALYTRTARSQTS